MRRLMVGDGEFLTTKYSKHSKKKISCRGRVVEEWGLWYYVGLGRGIWEVGAAGMVDRDRVMASEKVDL